jgi:hypothetical protein
MSQSLQLLPADYPRKLKKYDLTDEGIVCKRKHIEKNQTGTE